ncbi:uncharacterized protein ZBAI_08772 [Zygosaccharomyces bailii ISA1307]|nr:uncharacterized protein ZBAI_08772 [Zygosaccharomyces bailii ISA1307]
MSSCGSHDDGFFEDLGSGPGEPELEAGSEPTLLCDAAATNSFIAAASASPARGLLVAVVSTVALVTEVDTVEAFLKWCECRGGCGCELSNDNLADALAGRFDLETVIGFLWK